MKADRPTAAIVLAAGVGSRLRPLTDDRPKCLVPLGGETILHRAVRLLAEAGATRLIVSTGYRAEALHQALREAPLPVSFVHNPDYATTQNVVSLARALRALAPGEGFVKLDGDVVFTPAVLDALGRAADEGADGAVAVDRSAALGAEEMKVLVDAGRVVRFGKGLAPAAAHGESIGIEWFAARSAPAVAAVMDRALARGRTEVYYEDVYNDLLAERAELRVAAVEVAADEWTEIDDLDDLDRARRAFAPASP